jgi:poly(3-hydroxybutyrate) depolymerase
MVSFRRMTVLAAAWALLAPLGASAASRLPALRADPARTSVSGLSSGAFMAGQYEVPFSASTIGVGVVAGGPYNCGYVNVAASVTCMQGSPSAANSYAAAQGFAALGQIDPVSNIARARVYLFSGTKDAVVGQSVMNAVRDFYRLAHVPDADLAYVDTIPAGHGFISSEAKNPCATNATPWVNQCLVDGAPYDQPGAILTQIYGPLQAKVPTPSLSARPLAFDQTPFTSLMANMAVAGYVYVPAACAKTKGLGCVVHVVFHGCLQSADGAEAGDAVYRRVGYNAWADATTSSSSTPSCRPWAAGIGWGRPASTSRPAMARSCRRCAPWSTG